MIKNFQIFSNKLKNKEQDPDYRLSAKIGEQFVEIGAGWKKTTTGNDPKTGKPSAYISCSLSKPYMKDGKQIDGYEIKKQTGDLSEEDAEILKQARESQAKAEKEFNEIGEDEISPEDIPF